MNVKRFTARTAREALALVRQAFGAEAVVLSTRPCSEGIEVLAMGPEGMAQIEQAAAAAAAAPQPTPLAPRTLPAEAVRRETVRREPSFSPQDDATELGMSTMSFQGYVRERMLKRREAALRDEAGEALAARAATQASTAAQGMPAQRPAFSPRIAQLMVVVTSELAEEFWVSV